MLSLRRLGSYRKKRPFFAHVVVGEPPLRLLFSSAGMAQRAKELDNLNKVIEKVIQEAHESGAAIVGIVPVDTVKQVHRNKVRATLPRERLILTQTPQVFRLKLLRQAFEKARQDLFVGTDESSLVERLEEVEVSVVMGSDRNIKITKPTDMDLARLYLALEGSPLEVS
jgi:dihydroxyacetone kinase-like predicted kinase